MGLDWWGTGKRGGRWRKIGVRKTERSAERKKREEGGRREERRRKGKIRGKDNISQ